MEEKEKIESKLEIALEEISLIFVLKADNTNLRQITKLFTQRESTLVTRIEELEKTISQWNRSSVSMDSLIAS